MLVALGIALVLQQPPTPGSQRPAAARDASADTVLKVSVARRGANAGRRLPVTAQVLATAFKDPTARITLLKAREARLSQDSSLVGYDATAYERISAGIGFAKIGRDRLLFRHENASHVHWRRGVGAWVEVTGARTAVPAVFDDDQDPDMRDKRRKGGGSNVSVSDDVSPVPYYPGYESLWIGGSVARAQVDERELVHPLADGAEAYYTYATGDSLTMKLPDGKTIRLRELSVRPREPKWNVVVGSLWFDVASGQLVQAAYRLAVPIDVWVVAKEDDPKAMDDVPFWVKPLISPMKAEVSAIAIEYSLHEGRFWLPRIRAAEGGAQVGFMRVPFKMEQSFAYSSVNGTDTLPTAVVAAMARSRDQMERDSVRRAGEANLDSAGRAALTRTRDSVRAVRRDSMRAANTALRDSIRLGLRPARGPMPSVCDTADHRVTDRIRSDAGLITVIQTPCDADALEHSPDLPPSIFDPGEEMFGVKEQEALIAQALSLGAQPPMVLTHLPPPMFVWGTELMRYNRVEGFSAGARLDQVLGGGYDASALGRLGLGDLRPNAELTLTRTNLTESVHLGGYTHLVSANDWGRPLSFGSSISGLLFGRDEGFYYYASGAELGGAREALFGHGAHVEWRLFAEDDRTAQVNATKGLNGSLYPPNLVANAGWYSGAAIRATHTYGLDPNGFRLLSDIRIEAAVGDSLYGRAAFDVTASRGLGPAVGALTLSGGNSAGALPPQRRWYLGGSQTVRGQQPDTAQSGNAFWFTRAEVGPKGAGFRPTLFADLGWVGDRSKLDQVGRPMSGVGSGLSFMDGLFRFDVARGLYPRRQWRVDASVEARF